MIKRRDFALPPEFAVSNSALVHLQKIHTLPPEAWEGYIRPLTWCVGFEWQSPDHLRLALACLVGERNLVRTLLDKNPGFLNIPCVPVDLVNEFGVLASEGYGSGRGVSMTPLTVAISQGHVGLVEDLLGRPGIAVNDAYPDDKASAANGFRDWSPLGQVTSLVTDAETMEEAKPFLAITKALLEAGAEPFETGTPENPQTYAPFFDGFFGLTGETFYTREVFEVDIELFRLFLPYVSLARPLEGQDPMVVLVAEMGEEARDPHQKKYGNNTPENLALLQEKTGIALNYPEIILAWLLENGTTHPAVTGFAEVHFPAAMSHVEKKTLQESLDEAPVQSSRSFRL
jgi:hypothetical protein